MEFIRQILQTTVISNGRDYCVLGKEKENYFAERERFEDERMDKNTTGG